MIKYDETTYKIKKVIKNIVVLILISVYFGIGIYFRTILHKDIVYTHFAYIPIVLSGLWWGRRGIYTAVVLAVITLGFRMWTEVSGPIWEDISRTVFFVLVSGFVGLLSEKVLRTHKALVESEEKYRLFTEHSLVGTVVQKNGRIKIVNNRLCEILGYESNELIGKSLLELILEEDRDKSAEIIAGGSSEGVSRPYGEVRLKRKDGKAIWTDLVGGDTFIEGESSTIINIYDITDRKEMENKRIELMELSRRQEEQLIHSRRLAELGEMSASIAHEINQPLTGIRNFAKNASYMIESDGCSNDEVKGNLRQIIEQVDRASRIINQMRSLARKSDRLMALADINRILLDCVEFLMPQFRLHGIEVILELEKFLPPVVCDRIRLEQVFLNIMTNARQAMEGASKRNLKIKTRASLNSICSVVVEIEDTGTGISCEDQEKIFTPFYTTKKSGEGTGLGLSISMNIMKEHGGGISAVSEPGVGSSFRVTLPIPDMGG